MKVNIRSALPITKPAPLGPLHQSADLDRQSFGQSRVAQRRSNPSIGAIGTKLDNRTLRQYGKARDHQPMPRFQKTAGRSQLASFREKVGRLAGGKPPVGWGRSSQGCPQRPDDLSDRCCDNDRHGCDHRPEKGRRIRPRDSHPCDEAAEPIQPLRLRIFVYRAVFAARQNVAGQFADRGRGGFRQGKTRAPLPRLPIESVVRDGEGRSPRSGIGDRSNRPRARPDCSCW